MKVIIAGDFCPRYRVKECLERAEFETVFGEVKGLLSSSDYSIVNFECPIEGDASTPIKKSGPHLCCSTKGLEAVRYMGFDCVTLANNHFRDFDDEGVRCTLMECKHLGIDTIGGGLNIQETSKTLYRKIDGNILAIINCCEHEFSIATENRGGSNPLNPITQFYAIQEAKTKADHILVVVHGGHEHFQYPSTRMAETYRFL